MMTQGIEEMMQFLKCQSGFVGRGQGLSLGWVVFAVLALMLIMGSAQRVHASPVAAAACPDLDLYETRWLCDWTDICRNWKVDVGVLECKYRAATKVKVMKLPATGCIVADSQCPWTSCIDFVGCKIKGCPGWLCG